MLPRFGRRTLYLWGLAILAVLLLVIGSLGVAKSEHQSQSLTPSNVSSELGWAIGSMLLVYTFFYDVTVGPNSLVAEIPSVQLRSKSIVQHA